jgi:hypothetical protein
VTTARMQEVEQRKEQLPREIKIKEKSLFKSPHPNLLPEGEGVCTFRSTALGSGEGKATQEKTPHPNLLPEEKGHTLLSQQHCLLTAANPYYFKDIGSKQHQAGCFEPHFIRFIANQVKIVFKNSRIKI